MMRFLILCLLAASALAAPADNSDSRKAPDDKATDTKPTGGCPGGYQEGAEIERGRLVYKCQGGQVVPTGCIAEDLSKIPVGGNYDNGKYRRQCAVKGSDLSFEPSGCLDAKGQEHKPGDSWEDGDNFYTCQANAGGEPALQAQAQGCVEGGKRVNAKETVPKGNVTYECRPSVNGQYKLKPAGCVSDGKQLKPGDVVEQGRFWYNCSLHGRETVELKIGGCVSNGKRLNDGDRFEENGVSFECTIDSATKDIRVTACIENGIERKVGCYFTEGDYEYRCVEDKEKKSAKKVPVRCAYHVSGGTFNIDPGCFRRVDNSTVACRQEGESLKIEKGANEDSLKGSGLHAC